MKSKLPDVGESIFSRMTGLAKRAGAVNLAQGFPELRIDSKLTDLLQKRVSENNDQYAPVIGTHELRAGIGKLLRDRLGVSIDPDTQVTVTPGAAQAIFTAITAFIEPGDKVLLFAPFYESFVPAIRLQGGIPQIIQLEPPLFRIDWSLVERSLTKDTKMILINTPHNPTGALFKKNDLIELERIAVEHSLIILSDEVYFEIVFDGEKHVSPLQHSELASRTLSVYSFGKSLHVTGWKVGYCVGSKPLMEEFRKVHQTAVFSVHHSSQLAIADYLASGSNPCIATLFQRKRDRFLDQITNSQFRFRRCKGSYFQLLDYSEISDEDGTDFSIRLTRDHKVATVPISPFCVDGEYNSKLVRVCFAKSDENLDLAARRLCSIT